MGLLSTKGRGGMPKRAFTIAPKARTEAAFHEVHANPPAIVAQTARKEGPAQAKRQMVAIALSKARRK